jgi:carbonic anhydrase/acetyltransferase-like protein (isoleucine patch superfamily)
MAVRSFDARIPRIGERSYVHPSADVFGDVTIGRSVGLALKPACGETMARSWKVTIPASRTTA